MLSNVAFRLIHISDFQHPQKISRGCYVKFSKDGVFNLYMVADPSATKLGGNFMFTDKLRWYGSKASSNRRPTIPTPRIMLSGSPTITPQALARKPLITRGIFLLVYNLFCELWEMVSNGKL